jgi:hypothetical protein
VEGSFLLALFAQRESESSRHRKHSSSSTAPDSSSTIDGCPHAKSPVSQRHAWRIQELSHGALLKIDLLNTHLHFACPETGLVQAIMDLFWNFAAQRTVVWLVGQSRLI